MKKPRRMYAAVDYKGEPKVAADGHVPLYDNPEGARHGWGLGFVKPKVVEVEFRVVKKKRH